MMWWNNWPFLSSQTVAMVTIMKSLSAYYYYYWLYKKVCIYCVQMLINKKNMEKLLVCHSACILLCLFHLPVTWLLVFICLFLCKYVKNVRIMYTT